MSYAPDTLARPVDWSDDAACVERAGLFKEEDVAAEEEQRIVCAQCPVRATCLAEALREEGTSSYHHRSGMRGGLNPAQRSSLARRLREETKAGTLLEDAFVRIAQQHATLLKERSALIGGGHREWRASSPIAVNGAHYTPRQLTWFITYGHKPEGRLQQLCEHKGCISAEHLQDPGPPQLGCGTHNGYRAHRARNEEACRRCKDANAARDRRLCNTGTSVAFLARPDVSEAA